MKADGKKTKRFITDLFFLVIACCVEPDSFRNIAALGKGGNFLFAGVHNTAATTPQAHMEAILRAYRDMRGMYA